MRCMGGFPDEVRLEGYEKREGWAEEGEIQDDDEDSDLSELTEEEEE